MDASLQSIAILLVVLLLSMSIHEMMHAFAADWLGDPTARVMGRVSLNPIRHIDPFFTIALPLLLLISGSNFLFGAAKPVQVNFHRLKYGEFGGAIVGMIGPLTNLAIAAIAALLFNAVHPAIGSTAYDIFRITIMLNAGLFVFNSIPWPPLDGSRLLYAFAPRGLQEVMESVERMGIAGLAVFIFLFYSFGGFVGDIITKLVHLLAPGLII
jgi:Zn-dependent protease